MFRNLVILILVIGFSYGCKNAEKTDLPDNAIDPALVNNPVSSSPSGSSKKHVPVFQFETENHDFGTITEGEKVSFAFRFKNVGDGDLIIRAAQGSCGCTVPDYPKEAIKPGNEGIVNVSFNSEGREGRQEKTVTMISNTMPNTHVITITANVEKAGK